MRPETPQSGWPHKCHVWKFDSLWLSECRDCGTVTRHPAWDTAIAGALAHLESA